MRLNCQLRPSSPVDDNKSINKMIAAKFLFAALFIICLSWASEVSAEEEVVNDLAYGKTILPKVDLDLRTSTVPFFSPSC